MSAPNGPMVRQATMFIERTYKNGPSAASNDVLEVRVFETATASVQAKVGQTINLGNFESVRLEVGVSLPCYVEEVEDALLDASKRAGDFLTTEVNKIHAAIAESAPQKRRA